MAASVAPVVMNAAVAGFVITSSLCLMCVPQLNAQASSSSSPVIVVNPVDHRVLHNGTVSFYCRATGNPIPEVSWRRAGRRINNRQRFLVIDVPPGGSVLRLDGPRVRDAGPYECHAENGVGSPASAMVQLDVIPDGQTVPRGFPRITDSPQSVLRVDQHRSASLTCSATGEPSPTVLWLKDHVPINMSDSRLTVLPGGSLQIQNVDESDEGKYECYAQNAVGIAYSFTVNLYVKVMLTSPQFSSPPESVEVMPGGAANLTCVAIGSPMPHVRWRVGSTEMTDEDSFGQAVIGRSDLALTDIQVSVTYTCVAYSRLGSIEASAEIKVKALPKPPVNFTVVSVGVTSTQLGWSPGGTDPVESYVLRVRRRSAASASSSQTDNSEIADIGVTEHTLTELTPYTAYTAEVFAVNNIGRSLPATVDFTTAEDAPEDPPVNVRARPVSPSTVVVQWEEPRTPNGIVKGYKVYFTLMPNQPMSMWSVHSVDNSQLTTIGALQTNRTYSVSVIAFTSAGDGPPSSVLQVKTQLGVPEQPRKLRGEPVSSTSIRLMWDSPENVGGSVVAGSDSIDRYELYYNDTIGGRSFQVTVSPPVNTYLLDDLSPNTEYKFKVSAASTRGEGSSSSPVTVRTLEAAPSAAPQSVLGEAVDSTSIRVTWQPPPADHQNGVIMGYRVLYAEASEEDVDQSKTASIPASETWYIVRGLSKWTRYSVWLLAFTAAGEGPRSDVIVVQTAEDVPGEPRKVKVEALNSTAINVQWRPPADREHNGVIRGYLVTYVRMNDREESIGEARVFDVMNGSRLDAVIGGLEPEVLYQVQVAAYTRKGDGERSRPKKVKTKGSVLGPPRNLQLTLTQEDPPVFLATWQAPRNALTAIVNYRVEYGIRGGDEPEERLLEQDRYRFTSSFLDRGVEYEFRVSAKNSIDFGEPAVATIQTPEGVPSGAPLNVTSSHVTATSVRLRWNAPALRHRNGLIILYEIVYRPDANFIDEWTTNTSDTTIVIDGLQPAKDYQFQIRAYTSRGSGQWSEQMQVRTASRTGFKPPGDALPAPLNVRIKRLSPSSMEVAWDVPPMASTLGIIGYSVYYSQHVTPDVEQWPSVETGPVSSVTIARLEPRSAYAAAVRSRSADGRYSSTSRIAVDNKLESEDAVQDFRDRKHFTNSILLEWTPPKRAGVIRYKIQYEGSKHYRDAAGVLLSLNDAKGETVTAGTERSAFVASLVPKTPYVFNISAGFADGTWGPSITLHAETLPDAPLEMQQPMFDKRNQDSSVSLRIYPASERNGPISHYYIVVVTGDLANKRHPDNISLSELQESVADRPMWIAARFFSANLPKTVSIGDGSYPGTGEYYNKPLMKRSPYRIFVRSFVSDNKFTSSPYSESFVAESLIDFEPVTAATAPAGMELVWIVAPICIAIILILFIILIIVYLRKKSCKKQPQPLGATKVLLPPGEVLSYSHDPVELRRLNFQTPGMANHPPIPVAQLADYVARLRASDGEGYSREYESIEPGQPFTWDASSSDLNKSKNRYANVVAYDHSRVVLQPFEDIPGSDYINANFMDGYCRPKAYIATQGPLVETFGDFWRMVWEQQVTTIVMMTKLEERNRIKCDQYWPNRGTEIYGLVQVTITDVLELATFTVRTFQISLGNYLDKREVRQFQFTAWPDHGVPEHPLPLLQFIRRVKALTLQDGTPTVVHCSAGVGRTGTYIVIDAMLDRIKHERTLDVYGHVTVLRAQRNYMVQTEDQYVFIYEALLDAVESGCTEVPAESLFVIVQQLTSMYAVESTDPTQIPVTGMELEFKRLASIKVDPSKFGNANLPVNKHKNRLVNVLPLESTRVGLQPIRGVDGSDYINASFIDGYRFRRSYIATQGPLMETTEDFWRMLWEHNCSIIVMMTKLKEMGVEKCHQYWPEERSARYQYFVVDPLAQYNMPLYILREFKVTDARDGQSRTIRQFQFTDWPEQGVPSSGEGFIEFIGHVQKTKEQFGQDGPVTVHCSMGVGRTGVFITLSMILERMRYEGLVDMYQTVRMLWTQRPAIVQTEDQYAFCYRAALEYLSSFDHYAS